MRLLGIVLILLLLSVPSQAATIQDQLDIAARQGGGEVFLPCGIVQEYELRLGDNTALIGSGPCTIVPPITGMDSSDRRQFGLRVENLTVDGTYGAGYIGIDFRNVTNGIIRNVIVRNVQTGVLLYGASLYNLLEHVFTCAAVDGIEIGNGANQNTILGGKMDCSRIGVWISDSNGNTILGTSLENTPECLRVSGDWSGLSLHGVRCENAVGLSWW